MSKQIKAFNPELEPMLKTNEGRFVMFPLEHFDIWTKYKEAVASFWTPEVSRSDLYVSL